MSKRLADQPAARAALTRASTVRSTSASPVRQLVTEIRMAGSPSQTVPLIQQVPPSWAAASTCGVRSPAAPRRFRTRTGEPNQHLVEHHVVDDGDPLGPEPLGQGARPGRSWS